LEAGEEVDEEGVSLGVGHFEDAFLGQQGLDLVSGDYVSLLQRLDREVLARVSVLRQNHLENTPILVYF